MTVQDVDLTKRFHFVSKGTVLHTTNDPEEAKNLVAAYAKARNEAMQESSQFIDHPNPMIVDKGVRQATVASSAAIKHAIHSIHMPPVPPAQTVHQQPVVSDTSPEAQSAPPVTPVVQSEPAKES